MKFTFPKAFMLLQAMLALCCAAIGLSMLIKLHVKSLYHQKIIQSQAWALIHAMSARHIQDHPHSTAQYTWQKQLEHMLPQAQSQVQWHSGGEIVICWEGSACWVLE